MGNEMWNSIVVIFAGITGVAVLAVIFSKNANTTSVIQSFTSGYAQDLGVALSPITGGSGLGALNSPVTF